MHLQPVQQVAWHVNLGNISPVQVVRRAICVTWVLPCPLQVKSFALLVPQALTPRQLVLQIALHAWLVPLAPRRLPKDLYLAHYVLQVAST